MMFNNNTTKVNISGLYTKHASIIRIGDIITPILFEAFQAVAVLHYLARFP